MNFKIIFIPLQNLVLYSERLILNNYSNLSMVVYTDTALLTYIIKTCWFNDMAEYGTTSASTLYQLPGIYSGERQACCHRYQFYNGSIRRLRPSSTPPPAY